MSETEPANAASLIANARYRLRTGFNPGGRQVYTPDDEKLIANLADALESALKRTEKSS